MARVAGSERPQPCQDTLSGGFMQMQELPVLCGRYRRGKSSPTSYVIPPCPFVRARKPVQAVTFFITLGLKFGLNYDLAER